MSCRHARLIHKKEKRKKNNLFSLLWPTSQGLALPWDGVRCRGLQQRVNVIADCIVLAVFHFSTFSLSLFGFVLSFLSQLSSISCLCLDLLLPLVPPTRTPHCRLPTSGPVSPALKKGCCHREIACKCPGELHRVLSYRDVKCLKPLTQMVEPDSRTTQLQWCCKTLKGSCY